MVMSCNKYGLVGNIFRWTGDGYKLDGKKFGWVDKKPGFAGEKSNLSNGKLILCGNNCWFEDRYKQKKYKMFAMNSGSMAALLLKFGRRLIARWGAGNKISIAKYGMLRIAWELFVNKIISECKILHWIWLVGLEVEFNKEWVEIRKEAWRGMVRISEVGEFHEKTSNFSGENCCIDK